MSLSFIFAVLALIIGGLNAIRSRPPLWIAVVLLALAMVLPSLNTRGIVLR